MPGGPSFPIDFVVSIIVASCGQGESGEEVRVGRQDGAGGATDGTDDEQVEAGSW